MPDPVIPLVLHRVAVALGQRCPFGLSRLEHVAGADDAVRFTDVADGRRYRVVVVADDAADESRTRYPG